MVNHKYFLRKAFSLAKKGYGFVSPNPMVGSILVKDNKIIASGYHKKFGGPHAEVEVLANLSVSETEGATLYVTLEPCAHYGKTPPCLDLILAKKIATVVIGQVDPNPLVATKSIEALKMAGVEVVLLELPEIAWLNRKFNKWIKSSTPYICLKAGVTLDSKIADSSNSSKWITGSKARMHNYKLRQGFDAILVGANTACQDDPDLGLHGLSAGKELFRFILTSQADFRAKNSTLKVFRNENVAVVNSIEAFLEECASRQISSVMVEGGSEVISQFLKMKLFDEINLFIAPKLLGVKHKSLVADIGVDELNDSLNLEFKSVKKIGSDVLIKLVNRGIILS